MGLQDQAFENCEKWMQAYKGSESNLDKCLSPLNTLLMTEIPSSFHKMGFKCKSAFDLLVFHQCLLTLVMFRLSTEN